MDNMYILFHPSWPSFVDIQRISAEDADRYNRDRAAVGLEGRWCRIVLDDFFNYETKTSNLNKLVNP